MSRRLTCTGFALATIAAGLILRLSPLGLPAVIVKYGGSALWAVMIYWLVACAAANPRTRTRPTRIAPIALTIATAVELFKLVRTPPLDAFRLTLAGKLLLGRIFSPWDLLAYAAAITLTAFLDRKS